MRINPFELKTRIQALLLEFPELEADEDARLMTLESETDFNDVMSIVVDDIRSAAAMQDAIGARIKDLKSRADRFVQREMAWRKLAQQLMDAAHLRKVQLTEATLSIRHGQPSVTIIDPALIPEPFWRIKKEPNVSSIKEALKTGTEVSGAVLTNAADVLAILTK